MLKQLAPYIVLAVFNVLMLGGFSVATYRTPRNLFISLASFGLMTWWIYGAGFLPLSGLELAVVLGLLSWWTICALFSTRTDLSIPTLIPIIGTVIVCMLMEFSLVGIIILCMSMVLNCIYAILQVGFWHKYELRWDMFKNGSHKGYAIGFTGNTIHLGIMCMVYTFLSVYLIVFHHWAWIFLTVLFLYTLWLTKCRAGLAGLFIGSLYLLANVHYLLPLAFAIVLALFIFLTKPNYLSDMLTMKERLKYWQVAWMQIKETPIFGVGAGVYGIKVPFLQRILYVKTALKGYYPNHTRAHNDYIQHAVDFGLIGFLGYIGYLLLVMFTGIQSHNIGVIILISALVSLLTSGIFFHYLDIPILRPLIWILSFFILQLTTAPTGIQLNSWAWIGVIIYGLFILRFLIRELAADISFAPYYNSTAPPLITLSYKPNLTMARSFAVGRYLRQNDTWTAFNHAIHAIKLFDGNQVYWELWNNLGVVFMGVQCFSFAERCFEHALSFCPTYKSAIHNLELIKKLKQKVKEV